MSERDLKETIDELIMATVSGIWVETFEVADAFKAVSELAVDKGYGLCTWDMDECFRFYSGAEGYRRPSRKAKTKQTASSPRDLAPGGAVRGEVEEELYLRELPEAMKAFTALADERESQGDEETPILFIIKSPQLSPPRDLGLVIQMMENQCEQGRNLCKYLVVLTTDAKIPSELEKQFILVQHPLPSRERLLRILTEELALGEEELPEEGEETERVLDAAMGMTPLEVANAMALSAVREGEVRPDIVWEIKAQTLRKSAGLSLWKGQETFATLGGLSNLKGFCLRAIQNSSPDDPLRRPRGLLLLGVPGSGKSALAKALGHETSRPTLCLDVGALMGSFVGQTEGNTRQALRIVDAMAPCVLMIDEVEKFLAGAGSSGDSGVSSRLFGTFLTWLNDHTSDVFTICTCNDISKLPPEFSRAERFDGIFFVDLPTEEERAAIWRIYLKMFGLCGKLSPAEYMETVKLPADDDWTGAEIRACCRLAALMRVSLEKAAQNVIPIAVTSGDSVAGLRDWAAGRCLASSYPGRYQGPRRPKDKPTGSNGNARRKRPVSRKQRKRGSNGD